MPLILNVPSNLFWRCFFLSFQNGGEITHHLLYHQLSLFYSTKIGCIKICVTLCSCGHVISKVWPSFWVIRTLVWLLVSCFSCIFTLNQCCDFLSKTWVVLKCMIKLIVLCNKGRSTELMWMWAKAQICRFHIVRLGYQVSKILYR